MIARAVRALRIILMKDECDSGPCQNGGTCQDLFNGFHCRCTPQWEGDLCERDVDECSKMAGTGLGCQNGGTCRNLAGSYACTCAIGWYGLHCTQRTYDCSLQSSAELCGHGICVNQGGTGRGFVCICDQGWTKSNADGSCTVDVNECLGTHKPCSHDPPVACVNTPGSFQCSPCPTGFTGNGYQCADIDECQINNGGCSSSPLVQCINTRGSRVCGPCPPGYSGDGISCTQAGGLCKVNNGGCHPNARCVFNPALNYVQCVCPLGYAGSGFGPNGCIQGIANVNRTSACLRNPCKHGGTCVATPSGTYICRCRPAFGGPNCSVSVDPCDPSPCKNGGTCERIRSFILQHYRCLCPRGYTGPTCAQQIEGCVGRYFQSSGTIKFPAGNQTAFIGRPQTCAWTLYSTNRTRVANITFTNMNIGIVPNPRVCYGSYVEVYDGEGSSAPLIGQFCGSRPPKPIMSNHPVVFIMAKMAYSRISFSLNWTFVPRKCHEILNATTHGIISSPGSPGKYPLNAHCTWKIIAPLGKRIRFTFFSLDIENHRNCSFDYLEIRNGISDTGPVLRKLCNSVLPEPFLTSGHEAVVIFHSDSSRAGKGFQISYSPTEGLPGCGGTFTTPHGVITAPSKPGGTEYLDDLNCEWLISLPLGERIKIYVSSLNLEVNVGCNYDYLAIYDGPSKRSGEVGRWCGKETIPLFTSSSNEVLVVFESDSTYNDGGFVLNYRAVCGGLWSSPSGIIKSPYYPFHYPEDRSCTYTIQLRMGNAIKLNFIDFDLEDSDQCLYDYLKIYDGNNEASPLIGTYCGNNKPGLIVSTHNILYMVLTTDSAYAGRGFKANYTSVDISCGGILTEKSGTIYSPKYPEHYPMNHTCTWFISAPPGTTVQLTWHSFNLEKSYNCSRDWVAVYDKNPNLINSGQLGDRYCGNKLPPAMTASSNLMSIVLRTDSTVSAPGFSAFYVATDSRELCGGNFLTVDGEIHSPNYPNQYQNKLDCRWTITVPNGQQIELVFETFNIESSEPGKCGNDYLEIRNGGDDTSPLINRYCGSRVDKNIRSFSNQLFLRFVSDASVSAKGFKLTWNGAIVGCSGVLTSPSGSIISPNYPQPYGKDGECTYKIAVSQGSVVQLFIVDLDLEEHSTCALDFVEIYDGANKQARKLAKLCSQNHPPSLTSSTNYLFIFFRSDTSRQGRGFNFKYTTLCNVTTEKFSGSIETPGFPYTDTIVRDCFWKIIAPRGNRINITFSQYEIGGEQTPCDTAYLKLLEGSSGSTEPNHLLGQYCNTSVTPTRLTSTTNVIYVYFKTTPRNYYGASFRFEWVVSGCGGVFKRNPVGEISSPNYPNSYPHDVECVWYISVPLGSSINLSIDVLDLETSNECTYDYLEIYGGSDDTGPKLAKLCKKLTSAESTIISVSGNNAFIRFQSDASIRSKGFHARYNEVRNSKCGGKFISDSGLIHSHNYPQNYEPHDDCLYLIKVDTSHRVKLTFNDFDINAVDKNCSNGYVKVFDGDTESAPVLNKLCGNQLPAPILSTTNAILIRHKTDGFATAKGFSATYSTDCGANIVTDRSGTLIFSELNTTLLNWRYEAKCKWIIRSKNLNSKISVQFVLLEVPIPHPTESGINITRINPGVNIFAGDGIDAPFYGHYSGFQIPPSFTIPSSVITVVYRATDVLQGRFTMDYSVEDMSCGGFLFSLSGVIRSPNHPDPYPNNVECVWVLNAAPGSTMLFEFTKFDLQKSDSCNVDYVEIHQKSVTGPLVGVYCGNDLPKRIQSNATLWVKFRSGSDGNAGGFRAIYSMASQSEIDGLSGQIGSPLYPLIYYSDDIYSWRITVAPGYVIRITFTDFYIENYGEESEDCFNKLLIFSGFDVTASVFKELCGLYSPPPFSTETNVIYITLRKIFNSGSRFLLNWMLMKKETSSETTSSKEGECDTMVVFARGKNESFSFTSPNYPNEYKDDVTCQWIFQAPVGDHVRLTFRNIHMEAHPNCNADSISIYYGVRGNDEAWTLADKICGYNETFKVFKGTNLVKVVFSSDKSIHKTGFVGKAKIACGGELTGPNGVISEGPYSICQWNITVKPSRTIKISFTNFSLNGSPPCTSGNYILFRDGGRPDSPLLGAGKYCGSSADIDIPETTSNRLYIYYESKSSGGIVMKFEEKSISCGGNIILSKSWKSEVISSPNYPNIPPPHTECIWRIYTSSGESLHFDITDRFDMTPSLGCKDEYLELRDGSTEYSPLIGRYCLKTPNYIVTEQNSLYVKYFTDTDNPKDGFRATISLAKCGGTIYDSSIGSIMSPGYPLAYDSNVNCTWRLVTLEFRRFFFNVTVSLGSCSANKSDTLTIAEATDENITFIGPQVMSFCGTKSILLHSETNEIIVNFVSFRQPVHSSKRFFIINYRSIFQICGGYLNLASGIILSTGYPRVMASHCRWKIAVPEGRRVTLNIMDLDFEKSARNTFNQRLAIYNGFSYETPIVILTGEMPKKTFYESTGNKMLIVYVAKSGSSHRGFKANFTSLRPAVCGGKMDANHNGSLSLTTNNNESYMCEWKFSNTDPSVMSTITFSIIGNLNPFMKKNYDCFSSSSFMVFSDMVAMFGSFCSESKPYEPFVVSKVNDYSIIKLMKLAILEKDTKNVSFTLSWKVDTCGGRREEIAETVVKSPGETTYPPNVDCLWQISVLEGSTIKIHFDTFDLDTDCNHDYLKIFNGDTPVSPLLSTHCGNIVPADIITQSNYVTLLFHSDANVEKTGFQLKITEVTSGCGGVMHERTGLIQSPGYPSNYKINIECNWEIRATTGMHIGLVFKERFFIEDSPDCRKDYIEVSDYVNGQWKILKRLCGREIPKPLNSTSSRMKVFFKTDDSINADGFKAIWEFNCGGVINIQGPGHIYSPGWPSSYSNNLVCNYTLYAPKKAITATFDAFALEEASPMGCTFDKVQIWTKSYDYDDLESSGSFCDNKPPDQTSIGEMIIQFTTDPWRTNQGFSISYDIGSCGGDIIEDQTIISSPPPKEMIMEAKCVWNIVASPDRIVLLKLNKLRLYVSSNCTSERVEIWDTSKSVDNSNGTLLAKVCGSSDKFPIFRSSGNKMRVYFVSRFLTRRKGFNALISFGYGEKVGCGGTYSLPGDKSSSEQVITNPDIDRDGKYESNMDCHWLVSTTNDAKLIVDFVKMDLVPCDGNSSTVGCCDALEVYDGPSERNELIGRYCGTFIPRSLSSSSGYLAFRFVSDGTGQAGGFKITVKPHVSPCGSSVLNVGDTPKFLTSPNYDNNYPVSINCRWLLAGSRYRFISIHFIDLDIEDTSECTGDRLEIMDESVVPWKYGSGNNDTHRIVYEGNHMYKMGDPLPTEKHMYCGKGQPSDFYSSFSSRVMIRFISDSQKTSKGFKIQYSFASCTRNYTAPNGRILIKPMKENCTMTITAPTNYTISLYFSYFSIFKDFESGLCRNKLQFFEGTKKVTELCGGWEIPPPIFTEGNSLTLKLTSFGMSSGFDISYTTTDQGVGCGGSFYSVSGAFTSPMYPGNFRNYSYCCWKVTVPPPGLPGIFFYEFDLGAAVTCETDYVELFDLTPSGDKSLRTTYCGGDKPALFQGRTQSASVCYKTSVHNSGLGWSVRWSAIANVNN